MDIEPTTRSISNFDSIDITTNKKVLSINPNIEDTNVEQDLKLLSLKSWATFNHPQPSLSHYIINRSYSARSTCSDPNLLQNSNKIVSRKYEFTDFSLNTILQSTSISTDNNRLESQYSKNNISTIDTNNNTVNDYSLNSINLKKSHSTNSNISLSTHKQLPRARTFYDPQKLSLLEDAFNKDPYAPKSVRISIAKVLNVTENQIKVWFQNRRSKRRSIKICKSTNSTDCE